MSLYVSLLILLINTFAGKSWRGRLVNWVEKAGFKKIQKLLEISERERHHEILLMVKNLRELSCNPFPYTFPIIPHPLLAEVVEGEHYVIADLLTLVPRWLVENWQSVYGPSSRLWLERTPALPHEHLRRLIRATVSSFFLPSQASKKGRRVPEQWRMPGMGVEDFVP